MNTNKQLLGARLKEFRKRKNLTQDQLAEKVESAQKHIGNIERGAGFPSLAKLEIIAKELDVELQDLFTFTCLKSRNEIIQEITDFIQKADDRDLRILHKVFKDIMV